MNRGGLEIKKNRESPITIMISAITGGSSN